MKKIVVDKNHPLYKWIEMLTKKYDCNSLIAEHVYCNGKKPKNEKEAQKRVLNFFVALGQKYNYTPEQAILDIRGFRH
jgi:hypothetical protein